MDDLPTEIRVMTLNCWGLKYISKQRGPRLAEIGRRIAAASPAFHVVALQECWCQDDYLAIRRQTRLVLPYGKFYHSAAFGGGLVVLSRWPLEESAMVRYPLNGKPQAFYHGDWYVGKGVAVARIRFGPAREHVIEVLNTHVRCPLFPSLLSPPRGCHIYIASLLLTNNDNIQTHAPYHSNSYECHRTAQAWEMAKLARAAAERGHLVLALGDFNMTPRSLSHRLLTAHAPVRDAWRALHPDSSLGQADLPAERARRRPIPTAAFNLRENGVASDSVYNTWRWPAARQRLLGEGRPHLDVPPDTMDPGAKRLDYVFAGTGHASLAAADAPGAGGWYVRDARVGMVDVHPTLGCSVSDHFSVEAVLAYDPPAATSSALSPAAVGRSNGTVTTAISGSTAHDEKAAAGPKATSSHDSLPRAPPAPQVPRQRSDSDVALTNGAYLQSPTASERAAAAAATRPRPPPEDEDPLPGAVYDEILAMIHKHRRAEEREQRWLAGGFFAALVAVVACLVAVWFSPRNFVAFLLLLLSALGLAAGVVCGLIALLFYGSEMRALKEFEWEIRNAKEAAVGDGGVGADVSMPLARPQNGSKAWR